MKINKPKHKTNNPLQTRSGSSRLESFLHQSKTGAGEMGFDPWGTAEAELFPWDRIHSNQAGAGDQ